jgi:uncharacterized protein (DUF342 family)
MERQELFNGIEIMDGMADLHVVDDGLEAVVRLESMNISDDVFAALPGVLKDVGIIYGILPRPALQSDGSYLVARGRVPVPGQDGRIELEVNLKGHEDIFSSELLDRLERQKKENATHDLKDLRLVTNVKQGDVIARKIPPTRGVNGKNIFGEEMPAPGGKWVAFKPGCGVEITEHDSVLAASVDGKVDMEADGTISVQDEWVLDGSVDASTGHLEFWGRHLEITGYIAGGYRVRVAGDLEVGGNIEDESDVRTGGNLVVNGIVRAGETRVRVGGNLECAAIEYAAVRVNGNLVCNNYILDAKVDVRGEVMVTAGKGLVAGGRLRSGKSVQAGKLGTPANVFTEVRAGYDPVLMELAEKLHNEIGVLFSKKNQLRQGLGQVESVERQCGCTEKTTCIKKEICQALHAIKADVDEKKKELDSVDKKLSSLGASIIQVFGVTYPNVLVAIGNAELKVSSEVSGARFSFRKGQVVVVSEL